ncbi:hypothetical protein cypCar_00008031 [Cyprinus carpio]|nr:hypothetical protein cypCar_00008031 [Cyprinus carpio]
MASVPCRGGAGAAVVVQRAACVSPVLLLFSGHGSEPGLGRRGAPRNSLLYPRALGAVALGCRFYSLSPGSGGLMKQLLSSAVQDMGCIHSRRCIEQLRSGGTADPVLLLFTGLALVVCGTMLLSLTQLDMLHSGVTLLASGGAVVLGVMAYGVMVYVQGRRNIRR